MPIFPSTVFADVLAATVLEFKLLVVIGCVVREFEERVMAPVGVVVEGWLLRRVMAGGERRGGLDGRDWRGW